jgi:phenylacetaldehyde dehydrogenase
MHPKIAAMLDQYNVAEGTRNFLLKTHQLFIDGEFTPSIEGKRLPIYEPSTCQQLGDIAAGGTADIDCAVDAAKTAFNVGLWAEMKPAEREKILHRLANLIEEESQILAELESLDNGKAVTGALDFDILGAAGLLHYMAGWATKIEGHTRPVSEPGEHFAYTLKEPIGVVAAIVPWNWPFNMAMWKMAAPLAVGCTLVVKPAQQTSLTILYFCELCQRAGLPPGVVNVVTGSGATIGEHLASHADVNKVSFTGSTEVGRTVGRAAMEQMANVTLELGGKSPMIVFADADLDAVAENTRWSIFFNAGQVCSAGSRIYIHRSVYEPLLEKIAAVANNMKLAPGLDPECGMGPVVSESQFNSVLKYINLGKKEGARIICGGDAKMDGYFIKPTLFADTTNKMKIVQEEIFGPVLVAAPFDTEEEAIALANDSIYGLAASIWTKDLSRAHRLVSKLQAGSVWVNIHDPYDHNLPFGGYKQSGIGRDLGPEQLQHFLETKTVWIAM